MSKIWIFSLFPQFFATLLLFSLLLFDFGWFFVGEEIKIAPNAPNSEHASDLGVTAKPLVVVAYRFHCRDSIHQK